MPTLISYPATRHILTACFITANFEHLISLSDILEYSLFLPIAHKTIEVHPVLREQDHNLLFRQFPELNDYQRLFITSLNAGSVTLEEELKVLVAKLRQDPYKNRLYDECGEITFSALIRFANVLELLSPMQRKTLFDL